MKQTMRNIVAALALLLTSVGAWAADQVIVITQFNGNATTTAGTVTPTVANGVCTLTVTPANGYYLTVNNLTATKIVDGGEAQARQYLPSVDKETLQITATDASADPSGTTTYTFQMPQNGFDVKVVADFQKQTDITNYTVTLSGTSFAYTGSAITPGVTSVQDATGNTVTSANYTVAYTNNVNAATPNDQNPPTVTVTGKGTYTGSTSATFTIGKADITLTVSIDNWVYGEAAKAPVLTGNTGNGTVTYEYKVKNADDNTYTTNEPTDKGEYTLKATVDATPNYNGGSATTNFQITSQVVANATVTLETTNYTYDGQAKTPAVTQVTIGQTVVPATDYDVTYSNNTNAGEATVTVEFKNNYSGSASTKFTIAQADLTLAVTIENWVYGEAAKAPVLTGNTGNGAVTYKYKVKDADDNTYSDTVPTDKGEYTLKAIVAATTNYNGGTATTNFQITSQAVADATVTLETTTYTYDGQAKTPAVTQVSIGQTVVPATDYDVTYSNNTNAGEATVTVEFKNNYSGSASAKFTINKANSTVKTAPTAIQGLEYTGDEQALITAGEGENGTMQYSLDGQTYSTAIPTGKEVGTYTVYYKVVGNANYNDTQAQTITVKIAQQPQQTVYYDLWIGNVQVTSDNQVDILGDSNENDKIPASFTYNPNNNNLIISNNVDMNVDIVTSMDEGLVVYLEPNSINSIGRILFTGNESTAALTITTDGNNPGRLTLSANEDNLNDEFVVEGFADLILDPMTKLMIIQENEEELVYENNRLPTKKVTIGVVIKPLVEETTVKPTDDDFTNTDEEGETTDTDLSNTVVNDILYTLVATNEDGYDSEENCIVLNTPMTDEEAEEAITENTPGTEDFAEAYDGFVFLVPAGEGDIKLDVQTLNGYVLKVKIGEEGEPSVISVESREVIEIPYAVEEPTYVYVYNGGKGGNGSRLNAITRGKKTMVHVKVYSVTIKPSSVAAANPVGEASGGTYVGDTSGLEGQDYDEEEYIPTPVEPIIVIKTKDEVNTANDKWYNLNGQQIMEPTKKGLYIHDGKIYIKE